MKQPGVHRVALPAHLQEVAGWVERLLVHAGRKTAIRRTSSEAGHIPARYVFFDIERLSPIYYHHRTCPHTMPPPGEFSAAVSKLGIGDGRDGGGL